MQADLTSLNQFKSLVPADPHLGEDQGGNIARQEVSDLINNRGTKDQQTNLFWIAYATTGYEHRSISDNDPDTEPDSAWGASYGLPGASQQVVSAVFLEAIRDRFHALAEVGIFRAPTEAALKARVTVHELAHQFVVGDATPEGEHINHVHNLMFKDASLPFEGTFYFRPEHVRNLRVQWRSPADRPG
jgi:hypothetical protein